VVAVTAPHAKNKFRKSAAFSFRKRFARVAAQNLDKRLMVCTTLLGCNREKLVLGI